MSNLALTPNLDATAILKDAIDQVERQKLRSYAKSVITDKIDIPPELAKAWIHSKLCPRLYTSTVAYEVPHRLFHSYANRHVSESRQQAADRTHT